MNTWITKNFAFFIYRIIPIGIFISLHMGCATVLERRPESEVVNTGILEGSENFEIRNAKIKKKSEGQRELFSFNGQIERSWMEGRAKHHWDMVRVRRRVSEWREGRQANAIMTMTRNDGSVSSMVTVPREYNERRNPWIEPMSPIRKNETVNLPLTLNFKSKEGKILSTRRVRSGETIPFDILSAAYPFHEDFMIKINLEDDLVKINRSAEIEYHYGQAELISRFLTQGQLRPEQQPKLLWRDDERVEVGEKLNEEIEGGDRIWIELDLENDRKAGDAFDVKVGLYERGGREPVSQSNQGFHLKPGQTETIRMAYPIPFAKEDYLQHLTLEATDGFGNKSPVHSFQVAVHATSDLPVLEILSAQVRERPGGSKKGLEILIRNKGDRNAEDVKVEILNPSSSDILEDHTLTKPRIESHSQASIWISLQENQEENRDFSFSVQVRERMGMSSAKRDIVIPAVFLR
jgi:hypothetical protein